ncbi:MAG: CARDB domain-containing protein, partial [Patescibacteria group bacterium]
MHIIQRKFLFAFLGGALVLGQLMFIPSSTIRAESFTGGGYPSVDKTDGVWHFQFAADKWQAFSIPITEGLTYNFIKSYCGSLVNIYGMHDGGGYYLLGSSDVLGAGKGYWIKFGSDCPLNFSGTEYNYSPKTLAPNVSYFIGTEGKSTVLDNKKGTCNNLELLSLDSQGNYVTDSTGLMVNGWAYWLKNTSSQSCTFASGTKPDLVIEQIDILETVYQNKKVRVNAVIKNLGSNIYDLSSNAFSLSAEDFIDTRENNPIPLIYPLPTNSDPMGQDEQLVMEWEGYFIHSGNTIVEIKVDPSNLINESNENNNSLTKNIYVNALSATCTDSDGGKDYYTKGIASGWYGGVSGFSDDYCSTGGKDSQGNPVNLTEFYCLDGSSYGAIGYFCPNGCQDGACISDKQHDFIVQDIQAYFLPQVGNNMTLYIKFDDLFEPTDNLINYDFSIDAPGAVIGTSISQPKNSAEIWRTIKYNTVGKHSLTVTVDPNNKINETNENNNSKTYSIEITDVPTRPQITNYYVTDIESTTAKVVFETDVLTKSEVWYKTASEQDYQKYVAGTVYNTTHEVILNNLLAGTLYYYSISAIDKKNYTSPSKNGTFTTKSEKPDLIVSDFNWSPASPQLNQDVTMTVTIKNIGEVQVSDKFWVTVAHNRDSEIVSDVVGGYKEDSDVVAGGTILKSFKTKFTGAGAFAYTILIPDTDKERVYNNETYPPLNESSTANNSLTKTISVGPYETPLCVDSDGGANYHVKGWCTDALGAHEDKCVAVDASGRSNKCLTEYYCNKSTQRCDQAKGGEFECAFGCSENACIMKKKGITIPQAGEYYFKMNWYNAAERTTISLFSPSEKQIAQYYGKYPTVEAPQSLGIFKKGDNLLLSLKSSWWNTFYGPVYSSDPLNFKIETIDATHWKFAFEGPLRYDKNYNDGSFEIYRNATRPIPAVTDSDGGKDYYQKGVCRSEMNNYLPEEDKCLGANLLEYFPSTYNDGRGICGSEVYACPNGCGDGVCLLTATTAKPDFIVQNIRIANDSRDDKYYVYVKFRNIGGIAEAKTLTIETTDTASGQKYYSHNGAGEVLATGEARELPSYESLKTNASGIYNLTSKVDFNDAFAESDETNNTLTKTVKTETLIIVEQKPGSEEQQLRERIKRLELKITELERQVVETEKRLTLSINTALAHRVRGEIFLQTEEHGEAWYVDPVTEQRFYLKDGESAYRALQAFGLGISDANLRKIPVGLEERAERN